MFLQMHFFCHFHNEDNVRECIQWTSHISRGREGTISLRGFYNTVQIVKPLSVWQVEEEPTWKTTREKPPTIGRSTTTSSLWNPITCGLKIRIEIFQKQSPLWPLRLSYIKIRDNWRFVLFQRFLISVTSVMVEILQLMINSVPNLKGERH